jgi:N-acetylglutamate synthase-like GNAT family acetyltransferase
MQWKRIMNASAMTIRTATPDDVPALQRLIQSGRDSIEVDQDLLTTITGRRHTLVLDAGEGKLAAVAVVTLEPPRAHLEILAIADEYRGHGLEDRMIGVAEALCDAFGCATLDVEHRAA